MSRSEYPVLRKDVLSVSPLQTNDIISPAAYVTTFKSNYDLVNTLVDGGISKSRDIGD